MPLDVAGEVLVVRVAPLIQAWPGSLRLHCKDAGWRSVSLAMEYLVVMFGNCHGIRRGLGLLYQSRRRARGHRMCDSSEHTRRGLDASPVGLHYCIYGHCMGLEGNDLVVLESISKLVEGKWDFVLWEKALTGTGRGG
jgi:hypothetical protein